MSRLGDGSLSMLAYRDLSDARDRGGAARAFISVRDMVLCDSRPEKERDIAGGVFPEECEKTLIVLEWLG